MNTPLLSRLLFGRRVMAPVAICLLFATTAIAQTAYPDMPNVTKPSPEPAFPAGFDPFAPPVAAVSPNAGAPAIAEWTRTGRSDTTIALTGSRLSASTGPAAGKDTQFRLFGQGVIGSAMGTASILRLDGLKAVVILPAMPMDSEYLIWPINSAGAGYPVPINATEAWWIGPNAATRGDTVSVYGRNLAHNGTTATSYIYIQKSGNAGVWATVTAANPYKADFTVPASLANGDYQVWIHNGHGGHYGWSGPLTLTINNGMPWTAQTFNVKDYGAKGDGVTDDEAAIEATLVAARTSAWSTIYLPAGTYTVSRGFAPPSQVRWLGDGATKTFIKANAGFVKPTSYDGRRYCLFFNDGGANGVTFQDLTIDANGMMNGYLTMPIHMRSDTDVRFINVTLNAKGYDTADFHASNRISFQNCDIIGGGAGIFFGTATQVFIDGCRIYGTNDVNTMLSWWGGDGMSCTNTTAQDYDNTQADGWAQGRFFYGASTWGSNRDIYVGNNTTRALSVRPGFNNQNTGEQLLWENDTKYSGTPTSATATTITFGNNGFFADAGLLTGNYDAVIVNGTGLGQNRKIVGCTGTTISVSPTWNVPPDTSSTVIIAGVVSHCAIYHNILQGKSDYATRATASTGVEPFGNSYDFIVDNNAISQTRNGMYLWGMSATSLSPQGIDCVYFNYITNNTVENCVNGIVGISEAWNGWPASDPYPGISYLGNTCSDNIIYSVANNGLALWADGAPIGDQIDLNVFAGNTVSNTPTGILLEPDSRIVNVIAYKNFLSLGTATFSGSAGISLGKGEMPALLMNAYSGFATTYAGTQIPAPMTEAPSHVVSIQGTAHGSAVSTSLVLWNVGTSSLLWNATSDSPWLTVTNTTGSISNENAMSTLNLTCNPAALASGVYSGTVTVKSAVQVRKYTVIFTVVGNSTSTAIRKTGIATRANDRANLNR